MLTSSLALLRRAKGYNNRVMVYAHRRNKARYLAPKTPYVRSPLANKEPEDYRDTHDPRSGIEWYNRVRHRGAYRHWPWATWDDDPIGFHEDPTSRRTLSARHSSDNECVPRWDVYAEVGQEYNTKPSAPLSYVCPFIYPYVNKTYKMTELVTYVAAMEAALKSPSIEETLNRADELVEWADMQNVLPKSPGSSTSPSTAMVPHGLIQHVLLVCRDIVLQAKRKVYRAELQSERAILRTREMERYYALPFHRGEAMPKLLAQPSGRYPVGKYTYMNADEETEQVKIHPLQRPDGWFKDRMYPV